MTYQFNTEHAKKYGVDEAIIIYNFLFWVRKNKANNKHQHEGRTWTYNSYKALAELFDFWSKRQIRTRIESLVEQGVLRKGNFNKNNYDQTTWYAFEDVKTILRDCNFELTELSHQSDETDRPIPDNKPDKENTESNTPNNYEIPTQQQVEDYFREKDKVLEEDISLEAQKFINHYEDMDWRKNKGNGNRIDNWHRQAGTWMANYQQFNRDRIEESNSSNQNTPNMQFV